MTALEIASGIIDKLQEENRGILETLHKAQDTIKYSERQLKEKDRIIKVLEERLRAGTDGILEMTNRQKELTIKHLEMQIQKLLKENEDLEVRLEAVKAEICPKCETKLLLGENRENAGASKLYKPPAKSSGVLLQRKSSQTVCPNRVKALERILEHKDKRIMHLTNEVKKLTKLEEEQNKQIYRLTKLMPISRLPPESITECLLKEIQQLESQQQQSNGSSEPHVVNVLNRVNKPSTSYTFSNKTNPSKSAESLKTSAFTKRKTPSLNLLESQHTDTLDATKFESEVLHKRLQQLCHGISELKRLFAFESENLSHGLNTTANEFRSFKIKLKDIINNLNEIIQNIINSSGELRHEDDDLGYQSDDKYVISCLQERLKESLGMVTDYENENKALKESLEKLKTRMMHPDYLKRSGEKLLQSFSDSKQTSHCINDTRKLQEIIKHKEAQLEAAESHINTCQKFIEELQKNVKHDTFHRPQTQSNADKKIADSAFEQEIKILQTKLDVSEKNIKTCETVIEQLQDRNKCLEEENERLESELHEYKSKAVCEVGKNNGGSFSKFTETQTLKKFNQELQDKIKTLEETIKKLQDDVDSEKSKNVLSEALAQEKMLLQSKLDAADKQINTLERSLEILQERLKTAVDEKNRFEAELNEMVQKQHLAEAYENDVMALKRDLILKEDENQKLTEALHTLENKTLEMNHYRKSLHQEIENLCKALLENEESEDSETRKAIYKAAVLRSAQALLRLDDNYNVKNDDSERSSALDELTHQIQVYLTEVSRIHELLTIKEQEREELLKEYLDLDDHTLLKLSSPRLYETHVQGQPVNDNLQSSSDVNPSKSPDLPENETVPKTASAENVNFESAANAFELKSLHEELVETKSVTNYLLSSCYRLENLLSKEREDRAKLERELEVSQEIIKDLKTQVSSKNHMTKRLNNLIEWMRSKEYNDEISLDQLKNEIQWLAEKATTTETELCQYKEDNCKMKSELNSLKRELMNEKYEKAKTNNELKHLRQQMLNSQTILDETSVT